LHKAEASQSVVANAVSPEGGGIVPSKDAKAVIHELNYQGWLGRVSDTTAISDTVDMIFRIFNVPTGGTALWTETHNNVQCDKGIFNVLLGSISTLPVSIFTGTALWIETQAGADVLSPRKKLVSVGYAIKSEVADTAVIAGNSYRIEGSTLTDLDARWVNEGQVNAITTGMIADNAVGSSKIANSTIAREDVAPTFKAPYSDTADYSKATNVNYVDSARVSTNSYRWNNNLWGVDYPKSDKADTALFITGANVSGEVANANRADTASYSLSGIPSAHTHAGADITSEVANANRADTADYAPSTPDNDWTRSGNRVYTFNTTDSVGIGTATPGAKLDVAGRIWQTGTGQSVFLGEGAGNSDDLSNNNNVFIGYLAGFSNTTGYSNTFSGYRAGYSNTTGYYNTCLGYIANVGSGALFNATAIGYGVTVFASNRVCIGNTSVSWIGGQVGWSTYSDGRYKQNVREDVPGLSFITRLRPVTFNWDIHKMNLAIYGQDTTTLKANAEGKYAIENTKYTGFIAQDVEGEAKEIGYAFSGVDTSGGIKSLRYSEFVVPLVKAVQEQQKQIEAQQKEIELLKQQITELKK
ncbi:MAG: tail fiber domain-containing protein, partial [Candidatus Stahlbacteria bacterium]|nr:tail fiber domain-containing protein [Candidatus Stahlbacteria bacterium]